MALNQGKGLQSGDDDPVFDRVAIGVPATADGDQQPLRQEGVDGVQDSLLRAAKLIRHGLLGRVDARAVVAGLVGEQRHDRLPHRRAEVALVRRRNKVITHVVRAFEFRT
jgi:hypothetical protein